MAVRYPLMRNGMYTGTMRVEQQDEVLAVRDLKKVENLKHMIFDFKPAIIPELEERQISAREYAKENGWNTADLVGTLNDRQTVGTAFMYLSERSIIGDGVGLGKTAQVAALINLLREKKESHRFLMAVESTALFQTYSEMIRFTGLRIVWIPSQKAKLIKKVNSINWSNVDGILVDHNALSTDTFSMWISKNLYNAREVNSLGESKIVKRCKLFDTFILDESSVIKNVKTKVYQNTKNICDLAKRVHFMNATVFENNIMDIYYQVDMMNPELLPAKSRIEKEFSIYKKTEPYWIRDASGKPQMRQHWNRVGYKNQDKFKNSLRLFYLARTIEKDTNIYKVYEVEPTIEQSLAINRGNRYNEVLNCPTNLGIGIKFDRQSNPKLDKLCRVIQDECSGKQVMVYCFNIESQETIARELSAIGRKPVILNGQDSSSKKYENRAEIVNKFNSREYDVIITNIMKSLNLYNGEVCILFNVVANPSKQTQITGRIDRNVDNSIKTFILLLYKHTREETLYKEIAAQRERDSRSLTVDAAGAVSKFMQAIEDHEE